MKITTFASGSSGNCTLIQDNGTRLLIDAGISLRRIKTSLARYGLFLDDLSGVLITHEHADHVGALPMLVKNTFLPIYAPRTVASHLCRTVVGIEDRLRIITAGEPFFLKNLRITAFSTPHDTDESVGYRIDGSAAFGFCTDTGHVSETMLTYLQGCTGAVIEANHDPDMLRAGPYPFPLKRRIVSDRGHLSNDDCAALACRLAESGTRHLILGHLSRENNTPALARSTVCDALDQRGFTAVSVAVAPPDGDLTLEMEACSECR